MAEETMIEWADHTFNPWIGCTKLSPACDGCYAERWGARFGVGWGPHAERRRTSESTWQQPLAWNRKAERDGVRRRVFCASLADVFDNQVPAAWRDDLWSLIAATPRLDWLLLTKRPQNIAKMLPPNLSDLPAWGAGWSNVWLGTTVENQAEADRRIPHLLAVPAVVRFLSCEPLLEQVDLRSIECDGGYYVMDAFSAPTWNELHSGYDFEKEFDRAAFAEEHGMSLQRAKEIGPQKTHGEIAWVICGGESGPNARPSHLDWFRSLRDQCQSAGVPFFFKQWGEWLPGEIGQPPLIEWQDGRSVDGNLFDAEAPGIDDGLAMVADGERHVVFHRVGKKAAGALLDGREWREAPGG